jgi:YrhC-like protein
MNQQSKNLYEKMVDFKRFALILLAVGVFFYLGAIIPTSKSPEDLNMMIFTSISFLTVSILFFVRFKQCQRKLLDMEDDGQEKN